MINTIFERSKDALPRTRYDVLAKMMEEVGELSTEISIIEGYSTKKSGEDGIIGECVDVIITAVDLIFIESPNMKHEQILALVKNKLAKWEKQEKQDETF